VKLLVCSSEQTQCPPEAQAWVAVNEIAASPADLGITAQGITEAFGWGFGAVFFLWSLGYGLGAALKVIRKI